MADNPARPVAGHTVAVWAVLILAGLSALLAVVNTVLTYRNAELNAQAQERAQVINQGVQLSPLNEQLSKLIGSLAYQSADVDLSAVLQRHGITVSPAPNQAAPPYLNQAPAQPGTGDVVPADRGTATRKP